MSVLLAEDRTAVAHQLRALHDLQIAEPALHLVIAHDQKEYEIQLKAGLYKNGFE